MEIEEHFYTDDPSIGHPDVRTRRPDTDYYFLGNGSIHAAVQICRSGEGTPVGLLLMDPHRFGPKRAALTCDPKHGLEGTMVSVRMGDFFFSPDPQRLSAKWEETDGIPTVSVSWGNGPVRVVERFWCPHESYLQLARRVEVRMGDGDPGHAHLPANESISLSGGLATAMEKPLQIGDDGTARATLLYEVRPGEKSKDGHHPTVTSRWVEDVETSRKAAAYWTGLSTFQTDDEELNHLFRAARNHLPTAVDDGGRMDGSIWQYNVEWVRDQAHVAEALVRLGEQEKARTMLARLLDQFVSPEGDTVDSGRRRPASDVELDQNGELLAALGTYVDWSGDLELVDSRWEKIRSLAAFPFSDPFAHPPSGLLHNRRCYWERHGDHGIQDGFELMSQFWVAQGLKTAAGLAAALDRRQEEDRWRTAADGLRRALLEHPEFRLVEEDHFIKRRGTDGSWQRTIEMESACGLPRAIPLLQPGPHFLDPDASSVLPIAHGFIDPASELALGTLAHVEELWNQWWEGGGYGRYHASSEPDSPGAWPFPSLFVARAYAEAGEDEMVWRVLRWLCSTPGGTSGAWFENDGPRIAPPYPQVGFTPWTWGELVNLSVHHLLGVRPDLEGVTIRPRLLEGLGSMETTLLVREHRLHISYRPAGRGEEKCTSKRIPLPSSDLHLEILC